MQFSRKSRSGRSSINKNLHQTLNPLCSPIIVLGPHFNNESQQMASRLLINTPYIITFEVFFRRITLISFVKIQTTPYPFALPPRIIIWINFNLHFLEWFSNKLKIVWPIGFWKEDLKIFFSLYSYVKIGPALCPHLTSGVQNNLPLKKILPSIKTNLKLYSNIGIRNCLKMAQWL